MNWDTLFHGISGIMALAGIAVSFGYMKKAIEALREDVNSIKPLSNDVTALKTQMPMLTGEITHLRVIMEDIRGDLTAMKIEAAEDAVRVSNGKLKRKRG